MLKPGTMPSIIIILSSQAIRVGEALLKQTALLLPQLYDTFKTELETLTNTCDLDTEHQEVPSSAWLRNSLSSLLQDHMAYKSSIRKYGTLIYRYGGDLVHALTVALGQAKDKKCYCDDDDTALTQACHNINNKLQAQVNKLILSDSVEAYKIEQFNIDSFINELDPVVWKAICLITQSSSKKFTHVRKVRTVFAICQIFFTINRQCSFPLHTLLTDAIETCGGSIRLKTILNRLGVCASIETHARYVQHRVQMKQKDGILTGYSLNGPLIVSADNLDYQHSYSRVYNGIQSLSWHGTTVQIALPTVTELPLLEINHSGKQPISSNDSRSTNKRLYSTRCSSQTSFLKSPQPKKLRRMRTGVENRDTTQSQLHVNVESIPTQHRHEQLDKRGICMNDFELQENEIDCLAKLDETCQQYIVLKLANEEKSQSLLDLKLYYCLSQNIPIPEKTTILYWKVLNERCDDKETLLSVINDLYTDFILSGKTTHVILEGDQATYERLHSIRLEYGNESKWLVLFPGDWHILKNFQEVLLKVYFEAGLSDLAKSCGYLPRSVGTNFKRTHRFLLEAWEAVYRVLMKYFLFKTASSDFLQKVSAFVQNFPPSTNQTSAHRNLKEMIESIREMANHTCDFEGYMMHEAEKNQTLKFWIQFVLRDCMAYIAQYLAIRSANWNLRMAALKLMVPLFTAYDRPKYSKLIPLHIQEMFSLPLDVLSQLQDGRFSISILGRSGNSIGIDEGHEMGINKDCKENMTRTASFLSIRSSAMQNLESQIFADSTASGPQTQVTDLHTSDPESRKHEANVKTQVQKITTDSKVLPTVEAIPTTTSLSHLFNTQNLRPEQISDLCNFRKIAYKHYINYYILRTPSVQPPKHRKTLLTFTEKRARQKKGFQVEKERKLQLEVWKKRVSHALATGVKNMSYKQCIELPRAIATINGEPIKGTKANTTKVYEKRYAYVSPPVITTTVHNGWSPHTVVMEGMFLIHITPWTCHKTMGDYASFLPNQHILPYYRTESTSEVHLLFDNPVCQQYCQKYFERLRRDLANQISDDHSCGNFSEEMLTPAKWRQNVLNCRQCKRQLVSFLTQLYFLENIRYRLKTAQKFVTAGGLQGALAEKAMCVTKNAQTLVDERLTSNAEESDTRIWLHVLRTRKLVLSPDTDVYHIGLPVVSETELDVVVRLSSFSSIEQRLLHLPTLLMSFKNDPDLASVEESDIAEIIQTLFITTACDYISFFNGLGKASFLKTFFHYSGFITADTPSAPGKLKYEPNGYLAFFRLVGCVYFEKHKSAFIPAFPSPLTVFNSIEADDTLKQHQHYLDHIRDRIWTRVQYEEEMMPSHDALLRHWKKSCWISYIWRQATRRQILHPPLTDFGWKMPDSNTLEIDWDSESNVSKVRDHVAFIQKGCSCKTGCISTRCKCKKQTNHCGPGCKCTNCKNIPVTALTTEQQTKNSDTETEGSTSDGEDLAEEIENIMSRVFGHDKNEPLDTLDIVDTFERDPI